MFSALVLGGASWATSQPGAIGLKTLMYTAVVTASRYRSAGHGEPTAGQHLDPHGDARDGGVRDQASDIATVEKLDFMSL